MKILKWLLVLAIQTIILFILVIATFKLSIEFDLSIFPVTFLMVLGFDKLLMDFVPIWSRFRAMETKDV